MGIKEYKTDIFPEIKDWTNPQNKYRFAKDISKLSYWEWFWFHPTAYHLINYSMSILAILLFSAVGIWIYTKYQNIIILILPILVIGINIYRLTIKIREHKQNPHRNFYDTNMREYKMEET